MSGRNPQRQLPHWMILAIATPNIRSYDSRFYVWSLLIFLRCFASSFQGKAFPMIPPGRYELRDSFKTSKIILAKMSYCYFYSIDVSVYFFPYIAAELYLRD